MRIPLTTRDPSSSEAWATGYDFSLARATDAVEPLYDTALAAVTLLAPLVDGLDCDHSVGVCGCSERGVVADLLAQVNRFADAN